MQRQIDLAEDQIRRLQPMLDSIERITIEAQAHIDALAASGTFAAIERAARDCARLQEEIEAARRPQDFLPPYYRLD